MTRFLLTLNEAVNTVFAAIKYGKRGETYVPIAMAALVTDIAKALIGDRKIEIKITGIRPSEKLAEIMVSEEEIHHCIKRGDYYVIAPMLPELQEKGVKLDKALTKEYSSDDDLMNFNQTLAMLKKQKLLVGDDDYSVDGELLR